MSEFIEIGFWLFVFLALALRNVAKRAKEASETSKSIPTPTSRPDVQVAPPVASPSTFRAPRTPRARTPERDVRSGRRDRERSEHGRRRSILGDWSEHAREIEEQLEAQTPGRPPVEPPQRRRPGPPGPSAPEEETLLVPGRRIRPNEIGAGRDRRDRVTEASRPLDRLHAERAARPRLAARADAHRPARVRRPGPGGLDRFERYDPLQRAILLSEILGPPPGLGDEGPDLGRWDPPV